METFKNSLSLGVAVMQLIFNEELELELKRICQTYKLPRPFMIGCCQYLYYTKDPFLEIIQMNQRIHKLATSRVRICLTEDNIKTFFVHFAELNKCFIGDRFKSVVTN